MIYKYDIYEQTKYNSASCLFKKKIALFSLPKPIWEPESTAQINSQSVCVSVRHHLNTYISETNKETTMKLSRYVRS